MDTSGYRNLIPIIRALFMIANFAFNCLHQLDDEYLTLATIMNYGLLVIRDKV